MLTAVAVTTAAVEADGHAAASELRVLLPGDRARLGFLRAVQRVR
jgi:hypothetical protein